MSVQVTKDQLVAKLRELGFSYKAEMKRVELWKRAGSTRRVTMPRRTWFTEMQVKTVLSQAGASPPDIDAFLKSHAPC